MDCRQCEKCGARWLEGQLFWSTGKPGENVDLAGLVCNQYGDERCINPAKGQEGGQTWAKRAEALDSFAAEIARRGDDFIPGFHD